MNTLIPNRFLFDFEFPLAYRGAMPTVNGELDDWTNAEQLPKLGGIDGQVDFAEVWGCWNEKGIAIACRVNDRMTPLRCDPVRFWTGDNLRLCTDTRDARSNRRATRFCQQFYFLPTGGGARRANAVAGVNVFRGAREDAPPIATERLRVASKVGRDHYQLEALVPSECLFGFDPAEHPRMGFYYILEDMHYGQQYLTVGDELNWHRDPSTWATAALTRETRVATKRGSRKNTSRLAGQPE